MNGIKQGFGETLAVPADLHKVVLVLQSCLTLNLTFTLLISRLTIFNNKHIQLNTNLFLDCKLIKNLYEHLTSFSTIFY